MKVVIGIPHLGAIKAPTVLSLVGLVGTSKVPLRVAMQTGPFVHENRTRLVRMAQQAEATHILFLDSDIACPDDTLTRLLAHEQPIVGTMYYTRTWPPEHTVRMLHGQQGQETPTEPFIAQSLGTGCLLIQMAVFDQVALPWFDFRRDADGMVTTGEDVWFCERAQQAGFDIWCDPTIPVRHIGDYAY